MNHLFQKNKSLKDFSTFAIGGIARYFIEVASIESLREVLCYCFQEKLPFHALGKGSNSLFEDFDGLVIHNKISFCEIQEQIVSVGAGFSFSFLGAKTARQGLAGLEFASGIPASVGGAIFMNAGASGSETSDVLEEVTFIDEKGEEYIFPRNKLSFSYRYSCFHKRKGIIAAAKFQLKPSLSARKKQIEIITRRKQSQPLNEKSCGCIFQNPKEKSAGALIEECGLKGKKIGGAEVSLVHGNFIINRKNATTQDVLTLASLIKECVKERTGIELKMELRIISNELEKLSR